MAYVQLMYGPYMVYVCPIMAPIAFRSVISSAIRSAQRTDHEGTLAEKSVICCRIALYFNVRGKTKVKSLYFSFISLIKSINIGAKTVISDLRLPAKIEIIDLFFSKV